MFNKKKKRRKKKKNRIKKSGNHTFMPQWIYILVNFPYFWVCKIGIAGGHRIFKRIKEVDRTAKGYDFPIFLMFMPLAYQTEQFCHDIFKGLKIDNFGGSGSTERFYSIVIPFAIIIIVTCAFIIWSIPVVLIWKYFTMGGMEKTSEIINFIKSL